MKKVVIESPFASRNPKMAELYQKYLEACILDSLERGEAPFASHGFYTQWLKDSEPWEREKGMACGRAWAESAEIVAFYVDYGVSPGMLEMLDWVLEKGQGIVILPTPEIRRLSNWFNEEEEGEN